MQVTSILNSQIEEMEHAIHARIELNIDDRFFLTAEVPGVCG